MESIAKLNYRQQPFNLSLNPHRPSFPRPITSLSLPSSSPPFKFSPIKCSYSRDAPNKTSQNPNHPSLLETLTTAFKTTCITLATAAAALHISNYHHNKLAIAATAAAPLTADEESSSTNEDVPFDEQERTLEQYLADNPNDTDGLRALMEVRIKSKKLVEAIEVLDRLIELEPDDKEWPLLKGQMYTYIGDYDSAKKLFEELLEKNPLLVEAYHGLVMANSESTDSLNDVLKRIETAMNKCKKEKNKSDLRDFKLLVAQVRVMEEKYFDALKVYEELVKEEPRDFRPYLCQGIIYTLLRKKDEAEKKFDQFKKLVPKNHPYREYLLDNMFATKFFAGKVESER